VTIRIDALASDGRGVGRNEGLVWFVEDALPGDLVAVRVERRRARFVEAGVAARLESGDARREPPCPIRGECGGCPWMTLAEPAQADWKRRIVVAALERIAGLDRPEVAPVDRSPLSLGYRNKVEFTLSADPEGGAVAGLHRVRGAGVIDVEACAIQHPDADRAWRAVRDALAAVRDRAAWWRARDPVRVAVRRSSVDGAILLAIRSSRPLPGDREFARALIEGPAGIAGVVRIEARAGGRGGVREHALAGVGHLRERWLGTSFRLPAATFFQVNPGAAERLGERVLEACGQDSGRDVVDLYGGVGAYGWALSRAGNRCVVVEADAAAVRAGRDAHGEAVPPRFENAEVGAWLDAARDQARPELIVANPPRTGMGRPVAEAVAGLGAARIVVVSCDPATLARDLRPILAAGYRLGRVVPVDLFPQTPHVETVVTLDRSSVP